MPAAARFSKLLLFAACHSIPCKQFPGPYCSTQSPEIEPCKQRFGMDHCSRSCACETASRTHLTVFKRNRKSHLLTLQSVQCCTAYTHFRIIRGRTAQALEAVVHQRLQRKRTAMKGAGMWRSCCSTSMIGSTSVISSELVQNGRHRNLTMKGSCIIASGMKANM